MEFVNYLSEDLLWYDEFESKSMMKQFGRGLSNSVSRDGDDEAAVFRKAFSAPLEDYETFCSRVGIPPRDYPVLSSIDFNIPGGPLDETVVELTALEAHFKKSSFDEPFLIASETVASVTAVVAATTTDDLEVFELDEEDGAAPADDILSAVVTRGVSVRCDGLISEGDSLAILTSAADAATCLEEDDDESPSAGVAYAAAQHVPPPLYTPSTRSSNPTALTGSASGVQADTAVTVSGASLSSVASLPRGRATARRMLPAATDSRADPPGSAGQLVLESVHPFVDERDGSVSPPPRFTPKFSADDLKSVPHVQSG